ncbi:hypothetical protein GUJ93_ZPchr0006g44713 [Zizania palustris]|uniref:Uncharacterized protein n=1 Tax=Zizania palustris TaxID=103762 RepID=A0A8J5W1P9_ZIZPA|nr:hypothetical protein GUJ93_ZPchr0006g44713 [Zizania palustris]
MEDGASEISDWEVLSAASAHGGEDGDFVILVSGEGDGGGGGVLHNHFALVPSSDTASDAGFPGEGPWSGPEGEASEGLGLVDGLDWISERRLDLVEDDWSWSEQVQLGGVDETTGESSVLGAAVPCVEAFIAEEGGEAAAQAEIEREKDAAHGCGKLEFAPHATGDDLGSKFSDAAVVDDLYQFNLPLNSAVQLEDGMDTVEEEPVQRKSDNAASGCNESDDEVKDGSLPLAQAPAGANSLPVDASISDAAGADQEETVQGKNDNAASGCGEPDGEADDGPLPLSQAPGAGEGERRVAVWWMLPFRLLQGCAWKVKPIWSFSIATALLGLVVLGRRMYRMRRQAWGLPHIKIAFDDKKASQFAERAARLNEAFFIARRVPMLRTSPGAVLPW